MTHDEPVTVDASYRREWDDGFGARGWKLDVAMDDPMVIASTAETGDRLPTSVFVHDILDHHLCGLAMSGHRNEAIALTLLGLRTGISPDPDFAQMAEEDILRGNVNGEPMKSFLPPELVERVPAKYRNDNRLLIGCLLGQLGEAPLKRQLVDNFHRLGRDGLAAARDRFLGCGLDFDRRGVLGLCIQQLLETLDRQLQAADTDRLHGQFRLSDSGCAFYPDGSSTATAQQMLPPTRA